MPRSSKVIRREESWFFGDISEERKKRYSQVWKLYRTRYPGAAIGDKEGAAGDWPADEVLSDQWMTGDWPEFDTLYDKWSDLPSDDFALLAGKEAIGYSGDWGEKVVRLSRKTAYRLIRLGDRHAWIYDGRLYSTPETLTAEEATVLIQAKRGQKDRAVKRAKRQVATQSVPQGSGRRQAISDDAKIYVWRRDGGRCVTCGSNENLEYDHIIPVSMGGSDTERNLQLLCEPCNRSKGGNLA